MTRYDKYLGPLLMSAATLVTAVSVHEIHAIKQNPSLQPLTYHTPLVKRTEELEGRYNYLRDRLTWSITPSFDSNKIPHEPTLEQLTQMIAIVSEHQTLVNTPDYINYRKTTDRQFKAYFGLLWSTIMMIAGGGYSLSVMKKKTTRVERDAK